MKKVDYSLYLVTDSSLTLGRQLEWVVEQAVRGGVTVVQLREKSCSSREFYQLALSIKAMLSHYEVPLIINDRLDIALAVDADGLHIGQSDLPYPVARRVLGEGKIIGLSLESVDDARSANEIDVDYVAVSPVFGTATKTDTVKPLGLEGLRDIVQISRHKVLAIGGIDITNAASLLEAGAEGICVVSAIVSAPDPQVAAAELIALTRR